MLQSKIYKYKVLIMTDVLSKAMPKIFIYTANGTCNL